jgi:D-glycero-alpha-D-manno-heptose-7-phosphate kinase
MILPADRLRVLQDHLMLFFTGISRTAAEVARAQLDNLQSRAAELRAMQDMVPRAIEILSSPSSDVVEFGTLLGEAWALKRRLSDRVTNPTIDACYDAALRAGACGGKLLGAGGGGFMLLFVRPERQARVRDALRSLIQVPFRFDMSGSRIVLYQPDGW